MAVQANTDIRAYAIVKGVKLWQLAKYLGYVHENNFSRRLREELPEETKKEYRKAIDTLACAEGI